MRSNNDTSGVEANFNRELTRLIDKKSATILVALSGGPDSVALLHLLHAAAPKFQLKLLASHVNYSLRGRDSNADETFCRRLCGKLGIRLFVKRLRTGGLRKNLQNQARQIRYRFFAELATKHKIDFVATGHNRDDNVETVLMNLARGAGTFGLGGIPQVNDKIIRPLINFSRTDIEQYLNYGEIASRCDRTNTEPKYLRNRVRLNLLPQLTELFGNSVAANIHRTAQLMSEQEKLLRELANQALESSSSTTPLGKIVLDLDKLRVYHPMLRRIIIAICYERLTGSLKGFDFEASERVIGLDSHEASLVDMKSGIFAERCGNRLYLYSRTKPPRVTTLKLTGMLKLTAFDLVLTAEKMSRSELTESELRSGKNRKVYLDAKSVRGQVSIRPFRSGDRFTPLGMKGSKKLSDYFIDLKVDRPLRSEVPLLLVGSRIAWIIGYAISEEFRVSESTRTVLKMEIDTKSKPLK